MAGDFEPEVITLIPQLLHRSFGVRERGVIASGDIGHLRRGDGELDRKIDKRFR
jgi:hypothetical protein